jgi:hypothetical protein
MTVNKEDVLTWLTQLGTGWVSVAKLHEVYTANEVNDIMEFWDKLTDWHDGAYATKRYNLANYEKQYKNQYRSYKTSMGVEEYRLTKKAIRSLEE